MWNLNQVKQSASATTILTQAVRPIRAFTTPLVAILLMLALCGT